MLYAQFTHAAMPGPLDVTAVWKAQTRPEKPQ